MWTISCINIISDYLLFFFGCKIIFWININFFLPLTTNRTGWLVNASCVVKSLAVTWHSQKLKEEKKKIQIYEKLSWEIDSPIIKFKCCRSNPYWTIARMWLHAHRICTSTRPFVFLWIHANRFIVFLPWTRAPPIDDLTYEQCILIWIYFCVFWLLWESL